MAKSFTPPGTLATLLKQTDIFLLLLLLASLSLNVYLGWHVRRLSGSATQPEDTVKLALGTTVRPIIATSLSGQQETISYADAGKPTVFYVFSPKCVWCDRNTQNINAIASLRGDSFRIIGLSVLDEDLPGYVASHHLNFPIYKSLSPEAIQMLGLESTPQTIVIAPDGRVLKNWVGAYSKSAEPQVAEFFNIQLPGLTAPPD
ncbi:MAG TPA: hypothetical protein VF525_06875 [Pyrinomonadaceae bacterium]|jgi:peroxiredoxin